MIVKIVTGFGWDLFVECNEASQEVNVYGANAAGDVAGNAAVRFLKQNTNGVVFARLEGPSAPGDPFRLDENNVIKNIGV